VKRARAALLGVACWLGACVAPQPGAKSWAGEPTKPAAAPTSAVPARHCTWPNGAQAAASLTYDDALASQLRYALPVLDRAGLKATFFVSGGGIAEFAALAKTGHELASHTVKHPCNADLAALSLPEMASELDAGIAAVQALGTSAKLSFAYPCGQIRVKNQDSYVPLVKERFIAARGVAGVVANPDSVDLYNVPALFPPQSSDGSDVVEFIQRAQQSHGWAVIGVHGVSDAGEYLQLSQPAHDKIIAYLAEHQKELWTAPFGTVAEHIAGCK
jgi:peptidoglycan/xylan/chitin deacetylase (PgdA/CDA1 family)